MGLVSMILGLLDLADKLIDRAHQSGELTDTQAAMLRERAGLIFSKYDQAPPPPPGMKG